MEMSSDDLKKCVFYKRHETDVAYWVDDPKSFAPMISFDKKKIYSLYSDYPHNMTAEEIEIFSKENPYWRNYFATRFK